MPRSSLLVVLLVACSHEDGLYQQPPGVWVLPEQLVFARPSSACVTAALYVEGRAALDDVAVELDEGDPVSVRVPWTAGATPPLTLRLAWCPVDPDSSVAGLLTLAFLDADPLVVPFSGPEDPDHAP